jgi:Protein of unknown function (DUF3089).
LHDRIAGTPLAKRIVAAYVIGWPISKTADLPALGLPECTAPDQSGCILSWQTFAEPADPSLIFDTFDGTTGFTGASRKGTAVVCTNPLTGTPDAAAPAKANIGALFPSADLRTATIAAGQISAKCEGRGILSIGNPPNLVGNYVLPGNNYHVFDYSSVLGEHPIGCGKKTGGIQVQPTARLDKGAQQERCEIGSIWLDLSHS